MLEIILKTKAFSVIAPTILMVASCSNHSPSPPLSSSEYVGAFQEQTVIDIEPSHFSVLAASVSRDPVLITAIRQLVELFSAIPDPLLEEISSFQDVNPQLQELFLQVGIDAEQLAAQTEAAFAATEGPQFADLTNAQRALILGAATHAIAADAVEETESTPTGNSDGSGELITDPECENDCHLTFLLDLADETLEWQEEVSKCKEEGAALFCKWRAILAYAHAFNVARQKRNTCISACPKIPREDIDCFTDGDCDSNQFCHKNGVNDCRSRKDEGQICSRKNQCMSECCKPHISAGFLPICRPANKCN